MMGLALLLAGLPTVVAVRTPTAPALDGRLDDAVWRGATPFLAFTQKFPAEGRPPGEPTSVRVVYDDHAIYVGIACVQRLSPVVAQLTRRDHEVESDYVEVSLDTRADGKSAFSFSVNAAGVLMDGIRYHDTEISTDWDENWDARTARTAEGWSAELRIPLRILRFSEDPRAFGLQVVRFVSARQEQDELVLIPRDAAGEVSRYARLIGLEGLRSGPPVELRPFVLARAGNRVADASAGGDLKVHLGQALTLDLAVNPDFAQVEADQLVLNLTTFETFFPEKRPFFLEGSALFATPIQLLHTRRIGRAPEETSEPTTIYAAAKMVGELTRGFDVGVLSALTAEHLPDPLTSWNALRLQGDVGDNGHLGLLATATARETLHDAYAGGLDARWRGGAYAASGQVVGTRIEHGPRRLLLDGTTIASGDNGLGGRLYVAKEGGNLLWELNYDGASRKLDYNDLGFMLRQNQHQASAEIGYRTLEPFWGTHETSSKLALFESHNTGGLLLDRGASIETDWKLETFWHFRTELHYQAAHFDDREVGDGTALERTARAGLELVVGSDPRGAFSGQLETLTQVYAGGAYVEGSFEITLRPHAQLDFELEPEVTYTEGEVRAAAETLAGTPVFGKLKARSVGVTARSTLTFTPRLTLQAYAQLFLADGRYSAPSQAPAGTRVVRLADLAPAAAFPEDPGFEESVLNVNVVLRWEYALGSTLFLVYTHSERAHVGLLKISYWWG
jgi:hypothetical protein